MSKVISEKQKLLNQALHAQEPLFGTRDDGGGVAGRLPNALQRMHEAGVCDSVLDYGTGKGRLVDRLKNKLTKDIRVKGYDPAVSKFETKPKSAFDIVTCLDVLEHIEMESIDAVLNDIKILTNNFCYIVIDLQPAVKHLADGRNAHILLAPSEWWVTRFSQLFPCVSTFPIYHSSGVTQKIVLACAHRPEVLPAMYVFLIKLRLFSFKMSGGMIKKI